MKALTLYPEHAELFRLGLRTIETRSKPTKHRGTLWLHAGKRDPDCVTARCSPRSAAAIAAIPHGEPLTRGAIVAKANLENCVPIIEDKTGPRCFEPHFSLSGLDADVVSPSYGNWGYLFPAPMPEVGWYGEGDEPINKRHEMEFGDFTPGRWAWVMEDVQPLPEPVPCRGWLGIWTVPDDVAEKVMA